MCTTVQIKWEVNGQYVSRGGGAPRMRKGCRAHMRRKVVVRDDAVMAL
jgi:hypothetical protein